MANIVVKKPNSPTGGRMFEFTGHSDDLGFLAGRLEHPWEVWIQGPLGAVDTKYEVVFAATNRNQHDRLNFRTDLNLTRAEKTQHRFDNTLRSLFGIQSSRNFRRASVLIALIPQYRRVVLTVLQMQWS
jgi:hypothetical protein